MYKNNLKNKKQSATDADYPKRRKKRKSSLFFPLIMLLFIIFAAVSYCSEGKINPLHLEIPDFRHSNEQDAKQEIPVLPADTKVELAHSPQDTQVIEHKYYTIGYNHNTVQPNWVAYYLTRERLANPVASRTEDFREDELVKGGGATLYDYRGSGYDRGHMAPAADFRFDETAMSETFLLSNMSPQIHDFNAGIWEKCEATVRQNAKNEGDIYVVTGPVFLSDRKHSSIGQSKVAIPDAYYKVLLVYNDNDKKSIGFIIPHDGSLSGTLATYAMSVNDVENITGIDFFYNLPDEEEELIEKDFDASKWSFKKYQK